MSSMQQTMSPRHSTSMSPMRAIRQSNPAASQIPTSSPARQTLHQQLTSTSQPSSRLQAGSVQRTSSPRTSSYRNQQPHPHQYQVQSYPSMMRTPQDTSKDGGAAYAQMLQQSQQQAMRMQVPYNGELKAQQHPGFNPRYPASSWPANRMPHQQQTNNTASIQSHPQYLVPQNSQPHGQSRSVAIRPSINMQSTPGQYQQQQSMMQQSMDQQKQQRTSSIDKSNIHQPPTVDPTNYQHNIKSNRSNSNNMTAVHGANVRKPSSQQSQTPISTRQQQVATNFTSLLDDDTDFNLDTLLAENGGGFMQQLNSEPNLPPTVSASKTVDHSAIIPSNTSQLLPAPSSKLQINSVKNTIVSQPSINSQSSSLPISSSSQVMRVPSEKPVNVQQMPQNNMQSQFTSETRGVGQDSLTKLLTEDNIDSLRPMVSSLSNQNKPEVDRSITSLTKNSVVPENQVTNINKNVGQLDTEANIKEQTFNVTTCTNNDGKISNQSTIVPQSSSKMFSPKNSSVNVPPPLSGVNSQQVNTSVLKPIGKPEKTATLSYLPQDSMDPTKSQKKITTQQHGSLPATQEQNVSIIHKFKIFITCYLI